MFLNQLSTPLQKALFLELAMLVMMASHDDDASEQMAKYSSDAVLSKFLASISTKEEKMLKEYQKEAFTSAMYQDIDFVKKSLNTIDFKDAAIAGGLFETISQHGDAGAEFLISHRAGVEGAKFGAAIGGGISAVSNAIAVWTGNKELGDAVIDTAKDTLVEAYSYSSADRFPTLRVVLKTVIDEVLAQYGNDVEVKQEVMQYLLTNGEDILNLNPQKIQGCMASLPKIKQEILQRSVQAVLEPKQTMGITLSEREKKIILCELIGAAYSSGAFEAEEKQLLESICQTLDIDSEYIEEFDDVVAKLFKANQELAELINE